ncbi:Major Facilitator Superfamily (MFS) [Thraustotheca clavata]|uniref:Molybdate-anion transporter n=1 Tax=Thraustotheca clavata TaxID=74557 RepID=A0A1W0A2J2_9STRA|nr:Major Facilitator Superfamily (MFS) [Thraustotheca clavata]
MELLNWPPYVTIPCSVLAIMLGMLHVMPKQKKYVNESIKPLGFKKFQKQYVIVFWLVMFADWLQGPNMYTLYKSYGMDVGKLFMIGFLSSALSSCFVGQLVEKWGPKQACLIYCLLEVMINSMEHFPNFKLLVLSRILGGISTALLSLSFESWMINEHRRRQFPEELLGSTFALASEGSGIAAIIAGIVAQIGADKYGDIAPFQLAIIVTVLAAFFIAQWPNNYEKSLDNKTKSLSTSCDSGSLSHAMKIGFAYSIFEGAMYNFVFMWVPLLQQAASGPVPTGLIFSCFMLCIAIGGKLFGALCFIPTVTVAMIIAAISSITLAIPAWCPSLLSTFMTFLAYEMCIGVFIPCSAVLRATYFSPLHFNTLVAMFRLPTNLLVLGGMLLVDSIDMTRLLGACAVLLCVSALFLSQVKSKLNLN